MSSLGADITRKSSLQTYVTLGLFADRTLVRESMDAYAYFRWFDDEIDVRQKTKHGRLAFIRRQKNIINSAYRVPAGAHQCPDLRQEEQLIVQLIRNNPDRNNRFASFISNFVKVIEFDAGRKGRFISGKELDLYSDTLAVAVTDGIRYFINHDFGYPETDSAFRAAKGAHITHMLRDYFEDLDEGYFNIPEEYLRENRIGLKDTDSPAFRNWIKGQTSLARTLLRTGLTYWKNLPVYRAKLTAYWYYSRFEGVLEAIEHDGYTLRRSYSRKKDIASYVRIAGTGMKITADHFSRRWQHLLT